VILRLQITCSVETSFISPVRAGICIDMLREIIYLHISTSETPLSSGKGDWARYQNGGTSLEICRKCQRNWVFCRPLL